MKKGLLVLLIAVIPMLIPNLVSAVAIDVSGPGRAGEIVVFKEFMPNLASAVAIDVGDGEEGRPVDCRDLGCPIVEMLTDF
jgi:hypothetical protein